MARKQSGGQSASKKAAARAERVRKAKLRRIRNWSLGGVAVSALVAFAVVSAANAPTGLTAAEAWDLPAIGQTAQVQERVTLAEFSGSPTVVNFFASWCVECDRELPGFRNVSEELTDHIDFVGIASVETGNALFMPERHGVDWWPLARDVGGSNLSGLSEALGGGGRMPLTAFYDDAGNLVDVQLGSITEAELRARITQLYGIEA